jgi:putative heme transporter
VGSEILFGVFLTLALTFLFLKDGAAMWAWLMARVPPDRRATVDAAGRHAWTTTGGYMRGLTIVALFDAVGIGLALLLLGVPLVLTLAVLQFLLSYVPTIGAFVAGAVAVAVALGSEGVLTAAIVAVAAVAVQQIGNDVIEPWVMDRLIGLHPTVVLTAVTAGAVLWGIAGALLFVPLAAALTAGASVFWQRRTAARPDF